MDDTAREVRCPPPAMEAPRSLDNAIAGGEARKRTLVNEPDITYIDSAPEKQVVLSDKLEYLAHQVGGCQTDALLALLRRVMYEATVRAKR